MTAEVLVMNKSGVAIATDSVVSVETPDGPKSFNTINKLFRLSAREPVAIMIYGGVEFAQLPWETLILDFRGLLDTKKFATIQDYANAFLDYLRQVDLTEEDQSSMFLSMLHSHFSELSRNLREAIAQQDTEGLETTETSFDIVEACLESAEEELESLVDLGEYVGITFADVVRRYRREIYRARQHAIHHPTSIPMNRDCRKRFWRLAYLFLVKSAFSPNASGIVIAGFGDKQLLPSVRSYLIDGIFMNVMKHQLTNSRDITRKSEAFVLPFAQTEMVYRFMRGVDREYQAYLFDLFREFLVNFTDYAVNQYIPADRQSTAKSDLESILGDKMALFESMASGYRQTRFTKPIIDAVRNLPKHDLATLAEALVQLTSLQRKMSTNSETVGEPIDVAIVAKSDGFIWVKKKTYFDFQFNLQNRSLLS